MNHLPNTYRARAQIPDSVADIEQRALRAPPKPAHFAAIEHFINCRRTALEIAAELAKEKNAAKAATLTAEKNAALAALRSVALTAPEIGRLKGFDRIAAQRDAFLLHVTNFYNENSDADCELGVIALAHFYSDNKDGMCKLAESTMAALLHRRRETVSRAVKKATDAGRMLKLSEPRKKSRLAPVIPREFANYSNPAWLAEFLGIACDDLVTSTCDDLVTSQIQTCDEVRHELVTRSQHKLTPELTDDEEERTHRAHESGVASHLTEADRGLHFEVMNAFSRSPRDLATAGSPVMPKPAADANLEVRFAGWTQAAPPEIVLQCLRSVLADMQLRAHDLDRTKICQPSLSGFAGYLTKCMDEALPKAIAAAGTVRTKVAGEQAVQQSRVNTEEVIGAKKAAAVDRSITNTEKKRAAAGKGKRLARAAIGEEERQELDRIEEEARAQHEAETRPAASWRRAS